MLRVGLLYDRRPEGTAVTELESVIPFSESIKPRGIVGDRFRHCRDSVVTVHRSRPKGPHLTPAFHGTLFRLGSLYPCFTQTDTPSIRVASAFPPYPWRPATARHILRNQEDHHLRESDCFRFAVNAWMRRPRPLPKPPPSGASRLYVAGQPSLAARAITLAASYSLAGPYKIRPDRSFVSSPSAMSTLPLITTSLNPTAY